jgi:hypothetical protein
MKKYLRQVFLLGLCFALVSSLTAAPILFHAPLSGDSEVPPRDTTGSGHVSLWFDDTDSSWSLTGWFADLVGDSTAAHIHGPAFPWENAGVLHHLTIDVGARSGSITGSGWFTAEQVGWLHEGRLYVNLHSVVYPPGEIRGQLSPVPDAASAGITGLMGLFLLGAARLRQRVRG